MQFKLKKRGFKMRADNVAGASIGLADVARVLHVIGCRVTQETRVEDVEEEDDEAGNISQTHTSEPASDTTESERLEPSWELRRSRPLPAEPLPPEPLALTSPGPPARRVN
jgi:hypothetical protein